MTKKTKNVPRNSTQYTHLCSEYIIPASNILDKISYKAHDLYNRALYDLRQGLFHKQYVKGYEQLDSMFKKRYKARECIWGMCSQPNRLLKRSIRSGRLGLRPIKLTRRILASLRVSLECLNT